ncbi:hypothetical protein L3D22_01120 [Lysobacter soli]|uniref:hypothetical protein n=1 Tax=Lysobacter soli TaxID=453783 RepID=UPI00209D6180|nr:hypothetical protein [Lysobacter soli]UTA54501.1 hypothetical protein L3D22_01120 [Lysobacter soli]
MGLKIVVGIVCALLCVPLFVWGAWRLYEYRWYSVIIPEPLGISYSIEIGGESGLREGCGAAIFRMDEATARKIIEQGPRYLARAMVSRGHHDSYHTFFGWKKTPFVSGNAHGESTGLSPGLDCASIDRALQWKITDALRAPGAYYTHGPEMFLLVDPAARLIVLTYFG